MVDFRAKDLKDFEEPFAEQSICSCPRSPVWSYSESKRVVAWLLLSSIGTAKDVEELHRELIQVAASASFLRGLSFSIGARGSNSVLLQSSAMAERGNVQYQSKGETTEWEVSWRNCLLACSLFLVRLTTRNERWYSRHDPKLDDVLHFISDLFHFFLQSEQ